MQKKLIALAIAGFAGSAFAQSNVTVYGVMDATYDYIGASKSTAATQVKNDGRVSANSSYLGFKGVEDLGNGLKAVFQTEGGLSNDSAGSWGGSNRDTFVGLTGGFGSVLLGNFTGPARLIGAKVDVNSGATGIGFQGAIYGRGTTTSGASSGTRTGFDDRTANAVAYSSPNFSGFSAQAVWGAGSEAKDSTTRTDNVFALGLNYENGPFYAAYAYTLNDAKTAGANSDARSHRLGGVYKGGWGQVGVLWDSTDTNTSTSGNKRNAYLLNGKVNVGAGAIIAGWAKANKLDGVANTGASHYFVGYEHSLSKRTILKAVYAAVKNQSAANYNFYNGATGEVNGTVDGNDPKGLQVGIRHSF